MGFEENQNKGPATWQDACDPLDKVKKLVCT